MCAFPQKKLCISNKKLFLFVLPVVFVSILTLTPFIFESVELISGQTVPKPTPAAGVVLFALVTISSVVGGIVLLIRKTIKASKVDKGQFIYLLVGVALMFLLIIIFSFVLVTLFGNRTFIPLSAVFILPFVVFTSYAIIKHELLDIKIIGTEVLTFVLVIVAFGEIVLSSTFGEVIFRSGVFVALLIFGVLLIRSVIREVKHREKLQELTAKLKELDKQKDEFISVAAHELRSPLTAIKGYISMVVEGDGGKIEDKARSYLSDANAVNDRLIRLVNNMLNVSRIEEGRLVYQMEVVNLIKATQEIFNSFIFEAERKDLKFNLDVSHGVKDKVQVDPDRVREIIGNYVSNAIKFTDEGSVDIRITNPTSKVVRVEVIDTGPGITKEEQQKLFRKFSRASSTEGKTMGTGLGLYISKLLTEKFNGKVGLESEFGKGSNFWFELPLAKQ
jgi:signal transduction histidine kinase